MNASKAGGTVSNQTAELQARSRETTHQCSQLTLLCVFTERKDRRRSSKRGVQRKAAWEAVSILSFILSLQFNTRQGCKLYPLGFCPPTLTLISASKQVNCSGDELSMQESSLGRAKFAAAVSVAARKVAVV